MIRLRTSDFDYDLPSEYIAQIPLVERDFSRLLILNRQSGSIQHTTFRNIGSYLKSGDILVVNETRVIPARLFARKQPSGGRVEILLLRKLDRRTWVVLVGGKGLTKGKQLLVESSNHTGKVILAEITDVLDGSERQILFNQPIEPIFPNIGNVPLPPYIHTRLDDPERYQTVYAKNSGSAAAPTAGLHFSPRLLDELRSNGIQFANVTLHIGLDTFAPVNEEDPEEHKMHTEWCQVSQETADKVNQARDRGGKVVAVGTTSVRTLETATVGGYLNAYSGATKLYILPGYDFQIVDALITNFHLPRSTLIMLVSAFAGREKILQAYEVAKQANYRFYSFGDAMMIY